MPASVSPSPSTTPKLAGRSLARHATLEKAHDLKALSPFKIVLQPGFVKTDLNHGHGATPVETGVTTAPPLAAGVVGCSTEMSTASRSTLLLHIGQDWNSHTCERRLRTSSPSSNSIYQNQPRAKYVFIFRRTTVSRFELLPPRIWAALNYKRSKKRIVRALSAEKKHK
ncbi:uncharacterized protein KRP23_2435 [Phytophthora ramorum]|uniref:uncharacterized protein n=1 Tax=Phytophthora ramorum TaxID=164328 RepID=UPI0030B21E30|nr:hypothetical protein KRP23_2435 [Phytophthora ramorum]